MHRPAGRPVESWRRGGLQYQAVFITGCCFAPSLVNDKGGGYPRPARCLWELEASCPGRRTRVLSFCTEGSHQVSWKPLCWLVLRALVTCDVMATDRVCALSLALGFTVVRVSLRGSVFP